MPCVDRDTGADGHVTQEDREQQRLLVHRSSRGRKGPPATVSREDCPCLGIRLVASRTKSVAMVVYHPAVALS